MDLSLLIKSMPMVIMLVSLAWAAYSVEWLGSAVEPTLNQLAARHPETKAAKPGKPLPAVENIEKVENAIDQSVRDLFLNMADSKTAADPAKASANPAQPQADLDLDRIRGLTLNATLVQGRNQLAIIGGRTYGVGQTLMDAGGASLGLSLTKVFGDKVVLQGSSRHYVLAYPRGFDAPAAIQASQEGPSELAEIESLDPMLAVISSLPASLLGGTGVRMMGSPRGGSAAPPGLPWMPWTPAPGIRPPAPLRTDDAGGQD